MGPFEVLARVGSQSYRLALPDNWRIHPVFHVSLLKGYDQSGAGRHSAPMPVIVQDAEEYEVEQVLRHRQVGRGRGRRMEYLVLWKGYGTTQWEPEGHLENAPDKVAEYWASRKPP